jgi:hypothetical protein
MSMNISSSILRARAQCTSANLPKSPRFFISMDNRISRSLANKHRSLVFLSSSEPQTTNSLFPTMSYKAIGSLSNGEGLPIAVLSDSTSSSAVQPSSALYLQQSTLSGPIRAPQVIKIHALDHPIRVRALYYLELPWTLPDGWSRAPHPLGALIQSQEYNSMLAIRGFHD